MKIILDADESKDIWMDRGGGYIAADGRTVKGFDLRIGPMWLEFEDEMDVVALAKQILWRMGEGPKPIVEERP